jgi:hypothetical protein
MTSLADNPAVTNPRKALTRQQQDALLSIDHFRYQKPVKNGWAVGNKRFRVTTIEALAEHGLLSRQPRSLSITMAGRLVIDKLKGTSA